MKQQSIVIFYYSIIVLIGGFIGYFVAGSQASLITSSVCAVILFFGAVRVWQGCWIAYYITICLAASLCAFFTYRFFLSYKVAPGGIMALLSACLVIYLLLKGRNRAPS